MQQAVGRFVFFALAPTIYNIGIIIGITVFANGITLFGVTIFEGGIMGVALGVVLGSIMQLVVSSIGLAGMGFDYNFKIFWKNRGFRQVLKLYRLCPFRYGLFHNMSGETSVKDTAAMLGHNRLLFYMMPITSSVHYRAAPKADRRPDQR
jgi:hypothetical protein